jgi:O-antigen/teichoic acid export membrane protein
MAKLFSDNSLAPSAAPLAFQELNLNNNETLRARPRFFENLATVLTGQIACAGLALLVEVCYDRLLGPEGRGQISLALMAVTFGVLVGGLGGEIPITVWAADVQKKASNWLSAVFVAAILGCSGAMGLWMFAYWRWRGIFLKGITPALFFLVLVSIPATIGFGHLCAFLAGQERFRARAVVSLIEQLVGLAAIVGLLLFVRRNSEMAVLGNLVGLIVGAVAATVVLRPVLRGLLCISTAHRELLSALSLGVRGQLGNLATFFNYRLDVFIVNAFLNPAQVGLYAVGVVVSEALWQIPNAAAVALVPRTARTMEGGAEFTCMIARQVVLIALASGALMAVLSPALIPLAFGRAFSESVAVIWWILPGTVALSLGKVAAAALVGRRKPQFSSIFSMVSLVVTIALDLKLIPRLGIRGAALASSAAYLLNTVLLTATLKRELGVRWRDLIVPSRSEFVLYALALRRLAALLDRPVTAD